MSELDFDELDKAVNTLMGDVPKSEPPKMDDIKTLNINSSLADGTRPSFDQLNSALNEVNSVKPPRPEPTPAATQPAATIPSLATRRSGRFMDVVHPSSAMKGSQRPVRPMSRQGATLQPTESMPEEKADTPAEATPEDVVLVPAVERTPDLAPTNNTEREEVKNDWPDPLEMSDFGAEPSQPVTSPEFGQSHDTSEDQPGDDELFTVDEPADDDTEPLSSPFIADAKVEKRPLGGTPVEEPAEELSRPPVLGSLATEDVGVNDPTDQLPASPSEVEPQLPPELRSDLMAIETDGDTSANATPAPADITPEQTPASPEVATPTVLVAPAAPAAVQAPAPQPVVSTGPTSIPQQYQEEPSTGDAPNGSIYDTESYHQPLAHPAKTKSGWLWVIWILLLLIVGGGGAVALYFLGII